MKTGTVVVVKENYRDYDWSTPGLFEEVITTLDTHKVGVVAEYLDDCTRVLFPDGRDWSIPSSALTTATELYMEL